MSYLALYRRYRPNDFENLIGQEHIVTTLVNQIKNDRLGHAYLFTGTRGTGKTSAAKIFSKAINCLSPVNGSPCGNCEVCKALNDPSNIDVIEIDAASNNGVNEIRELRENVQYPPVHGRYKVYIIDEVHMLTGAAFNALLKTLEEPPKHAVFILATTEAHKIPATILSRCMRFDFRLIATDRIASLISKIFDEQGKSYEKEAVFAIAKAGEGSIRDALSIADIALSHADGKLTYDQVTEILGSSNTQTVIELTSFIMTGDTGSALSKVNELSGLGKSMGVLIKDVTEVLRDLLIIKTTENSQKILSLPLTKYNLLKEISDSVNQEKILRAMEIFSETEMNLKYSFHPRVLFETAVVKASKPQTDYDINALMERIKTLEEKVNNGNFSVKTEEVKEIKVVTEQKLPEKKDIEFTSEEIKGRLLTNLRKNGSEMLWNVMQNVSVKKINSMIVISPEDNADYELFNSKENFEKISRAIKEIGEFSITIEEGKKQKILGEIDDATETIKKLFGEDIVIIK